MCQILKLWNAGLVGDQGSRDWGGHPRTSGKLRGELSRIRWKICCGCQLGRRKKIIKGAHLRAEFSLGVPQSGCQSARSANGNTTVGAIVFNES